MDDETKETIADEREIRLYEVSYHLLPTVGEEALAGEVSKIKDLIESHDGVIISEELPKAFELAYPLPKVIANKRKYFTSALFGWVKFQGNPVKIPSLHDAFEKNESILRFLIIKVTEDRAVKPPRKMKFFSREKKPLPQKEMPSSVKREELSEAEIDKTIEELITK